MNQTFRPGIRTLLVFALLFASGAGGGVECPGPTLLEAGWERWEAQPGVSLGEWWLPPSPDRPEIRTEARLRATLEANPKDAEAANLVLTFDFPSAQPLGIPFTFQRVEISWLTPNGRWAETLDWADFCHDVGRSMFPRQSWSVRMPLPERPSWPLPNPILRLWGSQN